MQTLYEAQGISMHVALWEMAEHTGWQIIHAYCDSQGIKRKFSNRTSNKNNSDTKFDISFRENRDQDTTSIGKDYGNLKI